MTNERDTTGTSKEGASRESVSLLQLEETLLSRNFDIYDAVLDSKKSKFLLKQM